jgi:hypothetical protein
MLITWDYTINRQKIEMKQVINPPWTTRDDDMQAGDSPFTVEELATGHTKKIFIQPDPPPRHNYYTIPVIEKVEDDWGTCIPGKRIIHLYHMILLSHKNLYLQHTTSNQQT